MPNGLPLVGDGITESIRYSLMVCRDLLPLRSEGLNLEGSGFLGDTDRLFGADLLMKMLGPN